MKKCNLPFLLLAFFSACISANQIVINSEEQKYVIKLIERLSIDESKFKKVSREVKDKYSRVVGIKDRYYYKEKSRKDFWFATDKNDKIVALKISWTELSDLKEISNFTNLHILEVNSNKFRNLIGLDNLKKLEILNLVGNDLLVSLEGVKNLTNLKKIEAKTLDKLDTSSLVNLPNLEEFLCDSCTISELAPFKDMKNLRVLKTGVKELNIDYLSNLKNIEFLEIGGLTLKDVTAINSMPKLKHLKIFNASVNIVKLDCKSNSLEYIRFEDIPISKLPNFHSCKSLKDLSITGTDIKIIDSVNDLPELKKLVFARNINLKSIKNLKNLPQLTELKAYNSGINKIETEILPSLEELTLSRTNLIELPPFKNYPRLRRLILNDTKIRSLKGIEAAPYLHWVQTDYEVKKDPENAKLLRELRKNRFKRI